MAAKHNEGVGGGGGAGDAYLASLLDDKESAKEDLDRATEVRDKREAEIDRLTSELTQKETTPERQKELEQRIDKQNDLLAAAQADVTEARKRYVSLRCVSLIPPSTLVLLRVHLSPPLFSQIFLTPFSLLHRVSAFLTLAV